MTANPHIGTSFADFLEEEGIGAEVETHAVKRALAWQLERTMTEQNLTKTAMAKRMATSRAQLDRLLDPANAHVELATLQRAAEAVGRRLHVELR